MKEHTRDKFLFEKIEKEIRTVKDTPELVYKFITKKGEILFKTKLKHEDEYDKLLSRTKWISGYIEFINKKDNKVVISNIRYLKCDNRL